MRTWQPGKRQPLLTYSSSGWKLVGCRSSTVKKPVQQLVTGLKGCTSAVSLSASTHSRNACSTTPITFAVPDSVTHFSPHLLLLSPLTLTGCFVVCRCTWPKLIIATPAHFHLQVAKRHLVYMWASSLSFKSAQPDFGGKRRDCKDSHLLGSSIECGGFNWVEPGW